MKSFSRLLDLLRNLRPTVSTSLPFVFCIFTHPLLSLLQTSSRSISTSLTSCHTFDPTEVALHTHLSQDTNPLHLVSSEYCLDAIDSDPNPDADLGSESVFTTNSQSGHTIVPATLLLAHLSGLIGSETGLPGPGSILLDLDASFTGIVWVGEEVEFGLRVENPGDGDGDGDGEEALEDMRKRGNLRVGFRVVGKGDGEEEEVKMRGHVSVWCPFLREMDEKEEEL